MFFKFFCCENVNKNKNVHKKGVLQFLRKFMCENFAIYAKWDMDMDTDMYQDKDMAMDMDIRN